MPTCTKGKIRKFKILYYTNNIIVCVVNADEIMLTYVVEALHESGITHHRRHRGRYSHWQPTDGLIY